MAANNESPAAWLAALAPGDEVVVMYALSGSHWLARVAFVTGTRVFVRHGDDEMAFSRETGRSLTGGVFFTSYIEPILPSPRALVEVPRG